MHVFKGITICMRSCVQEVLRQCIRFVGMSSKAQCKYVHDHMCVRNTVLSFIFSVQLYGSGFDFSSC